MVFLCSLFLAYTLFSTVTLSVDSLIITCPFLVSTVLNVVELIRITMLIFYFIVLFIVLFILFFELVVSIFLLCTDNYL